MADTPHHVVALSGGKDARAFGSHLHHVQACGMSNMEEPVPEEKGFAPGWLRVELSQALRRVMESPYVSEGAKETFQGVASALDRSDRLRRPPPSIPLNPGLSQSRAGARR